MYQVGKCAKCIYDFKSKREPSSAPDRTGSGQAGNITPWCCNNIDNLDIAIYFNNFNDFLIIHIFNPIRLRVKFQYLKNGKS